VKKTVPQIRIPGRPWHFSGTEQDGGAEEQFVAEQAEHNREVLAELGRPGSRRRR